MAIKLPDFLKTITSGGAKSRILILFAAIGAIGAAIFIGARFMGGGGAVGPSRVVGAPTGLQSVPGAKMSPEFYRAVEQANAQAAQQAQISGGSAVPTLLNIPTAQGSQSGPCCEESCNAADAISALSKIGKISQEDVDKFTELAKNNLSTDAYATALNDSVKQSKLAPEDARKLLQCYKKQHQAQLVTESSRAMDALIKSGQIPLDTANQLLALQKSGISTEAYAKALDDLVKQGKITPQVAAQLLTQYTQQQLKEGAQSTVAQLEDLAKSGQIAPEAANVLSDLANRNATVDEYSAALNRLVTQGKMTPEMATKLLDQYKQAHGQSSLTSGATIGQIQDLAKSGQISSDAADQLTALVKRNATVDDYAKALDRLVAEGKIPPDVADQLLDQYKKAHGQVGMSPTMTTALTEARNAELADIDSLEKSGKISHETAEQMRKAIVANASPEAYRAMLAQLVKEKKLPPEDAARLVSKHNKVAAIKSATQRLVAMQGKNASLAEYTDELKKAVKSGALTPEQAAALLSEYQKTQAEKSAAAGVVLPPPANIPGAEEFAKVQQRLQAQMPEAPPPAPGIFTGSVAQEFAGTQQAQTDNEEQERQRRLQAVADAMSTQAQQLITAWQPTTMTHQGAVEDLTKDKGKAGAAGSSSSATSANEKEAGKEAVPEGPPLIKAGTILFAVLDTAVNSDYPDSPVMATIIQGQFKGAKIMGKLQVASSGQAQQQAQDKVTLSFTLMNMDAWPKTKTVTAFAIDPDTARMALASNVDYHYLKRYGGLFASSFLSGYAQAIQTAGSTTTISTTGTTTTVPPLSPKDKIAIGLGKVGTQLSNSFQNDINIPPTVIVNSGVGLGILFMADVTG